MKKKCIILLLTISMLVTFMPTMSFATDTSKSNTGSEIVLKAAKQGSNKIKLSWNKVDGATKYKIIGNLKGKSNKTLAKLGNVKNVVIKKVAGKKVNLKNAKNKYRFKIVAYNENNKPLEKSGSLVISKSKPVATTAVGNTNKVINNKDVDSEQKSSDKSLIGAAPEDNTISYSFYLGDTLLFTYEREKGSNNIGDDRNTPDQSAIVKRLKELGQSSGGTFKGWYTSPDFSGDQVGGKLPFTNMESRTYYANWDSSSVMYTVKSYYEEGNFYANRTTAIFYDQGGKEVSAAHNPGEGYVKSQNQTLKTSDGTVDVKEKGINDGELVLVLGYDAKVFTLRFYRNCGSVEDKIVSVPIKYRDTRLIVDAATQLGVKDPDGKRFTHWNTNKDDNETSYYVLNMVQSMGDINLYAQYIDNSYQITYNENTGKEGSQTKYQELSGNSAQKLLSYEELDFINKNHSFINWSVVSQHGFKEDSIGDTIENAADIPALTPLSEDAGIVLGANWNPYKFQVRYHHGIASADPNKVITSTPVDVDSNTELVSADACIYGQTAPWKSYESYVKYYDFAGWATMPGSTSANFKTYSDVADSLVKYDNDVVDLYAVWTPKKYTILYYDYDEQNRWKKIDEQKLTVDKEEVLAPNIGKRKGYTFKGWSTKIANSDPFVTKKGGNDKTDIPSTNTVRNLFENKSLIFEETDGTFEFKLYAVWQPITYKVCFHPNVYSLGEEYMKPVDKEADESVLTSENAGSLITYEYQYDIPLHGTYDLLPKNLNAFQDIPDDYKGGDFGYGEYKFVANINNNWDFIDLEKYNKDATSKSFSGWSHNRLSESYIPFISADSAQKTYNFTSIDNEVINLYGSWGIVDACKYAVDCYAPAIEGEKEYDINGVKYNLVDTIHVYTSADGEVIRKGDKIVIDPKTNEAVLSMQEKGYTYNDALTRSVAEFDNVEPLKGIVTDVNTDKDGLRIKLFFDRGDTAVNLEYYDEDGNKISDGKLGDAPKHLDSIKSGGDFMFPTAPTIPGYKFSYWKIKDSGEVRGHSELDVVNTHGYKVLNVDVYYEETGAVKFEYRTQDTNRVLFNDETKEKKWPGTEFNLVTKLSGEYYRGDYYELPNPGNDLPGYEFLGWLSEEDYNDFNENTYGATFIKEDFERLYQPGHTEKMSRDSGDDITYYGIYKEKTIRVVLRTNLDADINESKTTTLHLKLNSGYEQDINVNSGYNRTLIDIGAWTTQTTIPFVYNDPNGIRDNTLTVNVASPSGTSTCTTFDGWYNDNGKRFSLATSNFNSVKIENLVKDQYGALVDNQAIYARFEKKKLHELSKRRIFAIDISGYDVEDHGYIRFYDKNMKEILPNEPNYDFNKRINNWTSPDELLDANYYSVEKDSDKPYIFMYQTTNKGTNNETPKAVADKSKRFHYWKKSIEYITEFSPEKGICKKYGKYTDRASWPHFTNPDNIASSSYDGKYNTESLKNCITNKACAYDSDDMVGIFNYLDANWQDDDWYIPAKDEFQAIVDFLWSEGQKDAPRWTNSFAYLFDHFTFTSTFDFESSYDVRYLNFRNVQEDNMTKKVYDEYSGLFVPYIFTNHSKGWDLQLPGYDNTSFWKSGMSQIVDCRDTTIDTYNGYFLPVARVGSRGVDTKVTEGQYEEIDPLTGGAYKITYCDETGKTLATEEFKGGQTRTIKSPSDVNLKVEGKYFAGAWSTDSNCCTYDKTQHTKKSGVSVYTAGKSYQLFNDVKLYPVLAQRKLVGKLFYVNKDNYNTSERKYEFYDINGNYLSKNDDMSKWKKAAYYDTQGDNVDVQNYHHYKKDTYVAFLTYLTSNMSDFNEYTPYYANGTFLDLPSFYPKYQQQNKNSIIEYYLSRNVATSNYEDMNTTIGGGLNNTMSMIFNNIDYSVGDQYGRTRITMDEDKKDIELWWITPDYYSGLQKIGLNSPFAVLKDVYYQRKFDVNKNGSTDLVWYVPNVAEIKEFDKVVGLPNGKSAVTSEVTEYLTMRYDDRGYPIGQYPIALSKHFKHGASSAYNAEINSSETGKIYYQGKKVGSDAATPFISAHFYK